jgi:hypothetical protein
MTVLARSLGMCRLVAQYAALQCALDPQHMRVVIPGVALRV